MSVHISANPGEIASTVLMPGDPLRAKYIAEGYLENPTLVSSTRNVFFYTGSYKGERISIGASGMGCPSIGIYSYELFTEYNVECIVRIGTCGAYFEDIHLYDIINADVACSESSYAEQAFGINGNSIPHQGSTFKRINETAKKMSQSIISCNIHSSDVFYRAKPGLPDIVKEHDCKVVEMEAFALFANAKHLGKSAATILTVSDVIPTREHISADQREKSLDKMIRLALEATVGK